MLHQDPDFEQRTRLRSRSYLLVAGGVEVREKGWLLHFTSYHVPFADIVATPLVKRDYPKIGLFLAAISFALLVVALQEGLFKGSGSWMNALPYAGISTVILWLYVYLESYSIVRVSFGNWPLDLLKDVPSKTSMDSFIAHLVEMKRLHNEVSDQREAPRSVVEELERLGFLRDKGSLTEEEFRQVKMKILKEEQIDKRDEALWN